MKLKEQNYCKRHKSFEEQLKDFMKQSNDIQKDISRRSDNGGRRKRGRFSKPRREDI